MRRNAHPSRHLRLIHLTPATTTCCADLPLALCRLRVFGAAALALGHRTSRSATGSQPEAVVIGTGDGVLGLDIARKIRDAARSRRFPSHILPATCSPAPKSTSTYTSGWMCCIQSRRKKHLPGPSAYQKLPSCVRIVSHDRVFAVLQFRGVAHRRLVRIFMSLEPALHGLLQPCVTKQFLHRQ